MEYAAAIATAFNILLFSWLTMSNAWLATISFHKKNGVAGWFGSLALYFGVETMVRINFLLYRVAPALADYGELTPNSGWLQILLAIASTLIFYFTIIKRYHHVEPDQDL